MEEELQADIEGMKKNKEKKVYRFSEPDGVSQQRSKGLVLMIRSRFRSDNSGMLSVKPIPLVD
jgi:hypothetical protein